MNKHFTAALCPFFKEQLTDNNLTVALVAQVHKDSYILITADDEVRARIPGKFYEQGNIPAVGDRVLIKENPNASFVMIEKILERRNTFGRKEAGGVNEQVLGVNIDLAFIVFSLNGNLNVRRLERYLAQVRDNNIKPVIILTKSDLVDQQTVEQVLEEYQVILNSHEVIALSASQDEGLEQLEKYLTPGITAILIGSSGVGKSTLVNHLLGSDVQKIQEIRDDDDKGRHTTVTRSLHFLDNGSILLDTPGMRGFALWLSSEGLDQSFSDVLSLMKQCRFHNCSHKDDLGCAVNKALDTGELESDRYNSYLKLKNMERIQKVRRDQGLLKLERKKWAKISRDAKVRMSHKR
ncbi:ribosome small subunit-dependent GTPase A [Halobacteriovorax marinus]|uniref:Small ribosomal subunit biogenesis GTPase RsgA n=1 Tax=Halobacteriovorax marinus TaxID=97084 RepID=A0A1Y5FG42_9BACT|nr:ribosome small subunit-dependent GTPase A [Halobacteriovorax marinus]